jgi:2,5-diketo-D-gluconate reductase B
MQYHHVQSEKVPVLGYGTWQLNGEDCVKGVKAALDAGYRHIDTAQIYKNEEFVGKALSEHKTERQDIFLTTKIWMDNFGKDRFMASLDESLNKLQTDYVNMLLLHWPSEEHDFDQTLDLLLEAKKSGKARLIGVSNYTVALMEQAQQKTGNVLATNQVEFHPFIPQGPVLEWVRRHDMFLTAYSPLGRGEVIKNDVISAIAKKYQKNEGQITLRWAIQQEGVVAIPKAASQKHIEGNIDIFDFELTRDEMDKISALAHEGGRIVNPDFAPDWDTAKAA